MENPGYENSPFPSNVLVVEPEYCPQAALDWFLASKSGFNKDDLKVKARKHLSAMGWVCWYGQKGEKLELRYTSPTGRCFYSLRTACKACIDQEQVSESLGSNPVPQTECVAPRSLPESEASVSGSSPVWETADRNLEPMESINVDDEVRGDSVNHPKRKPRKMMKNMKKMRGNPSSSQSKSAIGSRKRGKDGGIRNSSNNKSHVTLSWLVENDVVLPGTRVHYRGKNGLAPLKEGYLTRDGVECCCCRKLFTLTGFEAHAGSSNHRPAANILLEDGRTLQDCQRQAISGDRSKTHTRKLQDNDEICAVCHYGGELVLCDRCPSSFHRRCLGLKDVPAGDWFCPSCVCGVCGCSELQEDKRNSMDDRFITCKQCERKFHSGCRRTEEKASRDQEFCGRKCEHLFLGLGRLLGKPIPVGGESLMWTLVKCRSPESCSLDSHDMEASTGNDSKLKAALELMNNCFEPVKDPHSNRDLIEEVIFSVGSELNRSKYHGFYTVLLERNNKLISVAIIKIHGERVAEVPLVCTGFEYRRCGMCGILMDELEKQLVALGVERLVLPAAPTVLETWTTSFGFSKMTSSERLQFLEYTFLDFQDAIMCQKLLSKNPAAEVVDQGPEESAASNVKFEPKCLDKEATFQKASSSNNCDYFKCYERRNSPVSRSQSSYNLSCSQKKKISVSESQVPSRDAGWRHLVSAI